MLCESSNLDKLNNDGGGGGGGSSEESSDCTIPKLHATNAATSTTMSSSVSLSDDASQTQASRISYFRNKGRLHPNIHHRPTIHPKDHYQRPGNASNRLDNNTNVKNDNNFNANTSSFNANDEDEKTSQNEFSTSVSSSNYHSEDNENDDYANMFDDMNVVSLFTYFEIIWCFNLDAIPLKEFSCNFLFACFSF